MEQNLSRDVLPENLRRGPYAVVDERCEDTTLDLNSMKDLLQRQFWHFFGPLYMRFITAILLALFLDPSIVCEVYYCGELGTFLDPSI